MGRNWETLSSKCSGVLFLKFRENLAEMPHSTKQKHHVLVAVLIYLCAVENRRMPLKCHVSEQRRTWAPPGPYGTPAVHSYYPVLTQISLVGCFWVRWAALPAGGLGDDWGCEEGERGLQFGSSLGVWEKLCRNSAMLLLKWSDEINYLAIQIALLAYQVNVRGI